MAEIEHRPEDNGAPSGWYARDYSSIFFAVCREKVNARFSKEILKRGKEGKELIEREKKGLEICRNFCEALERIWQAKPEKRWNLVNELVRSSDDRTSYWALNILREVKPEWTDDFYNNLLLDDTFPIVGQGYLDDLLCDLGGKQWSLSPRRYKMLKNWVTRKLTAEDAEIVVTHITNLWGSDWHWDFELRRLAKENKTIPESLKQRMYLP